MPAHRPRPPAWVQQRRPSMGAGAPRAEIARLQMLLRPWQDRALQISSPRFARRPAVVAGYSVGAWRKRARSAAARHDLGLERFDRSHELVMWHEHVVRP